MKMLLPLTVMAAVVLITCVEQSAGRPRYTMMDYQREMMKRSHKKMITEKDRSRIEDYLMEYKYLPLSRAVFDSLPPFMQDNMVKIAVSDFQRFIGKTPDGKVNSEVLEMMNTPRCGIEDVTSKKERAPFKTNTRTKRYALQGSSWSTDEITYRVSQYSQRVPRDVTDRSVQTALRLWSDVTNVQFFPVSEDSRAAMDIKFVEGGHSDSSPFDGPGTVLAHAFFPTNNRGRGLSGDAHFDDTETWVYTENGEDTMGADMVWVMAHEFGHSLGLDHSDVSDALMFPFARPYLPTIALHDNDVRGIQALYGTKEAPDGGTPPTTSPTSPRPTDVPRADEDDCSGTVDAVTQTPEDDITLVFKGSKVYRLLPEGGIESGYPRQISAEYEGFPPSVTGVDTAFTDTTNGIIFVIKDGNFWALKEARVMYTGPVSELELDSDTVVTFNFNPFRRVTVFTRLFGSFERVVAVHDSAYSSHRMSGGKFPQIGTSTRPLSRFRQVPFPVEDGVQWSNGKIYFFKGTEYFRFSTNTRSVDDGYPKSTAKLWFGCDQQ